MARSISPIEIHQLLLWKHPHVKTVKDACAIAARDYGLTSETMRTYAYNGIGYRSKAHAMIAADVEEMKRYEESGWRMVRDSERRLAEALEFHARTLRQVADQFSAIRSGIENRMNDRTDA